VSSDGPPDRDTLIRMIGELAETRSIDVSIRAPGPASDASSLAALTPISLAFEDAALAPEGFSASHPGADLLVTGKLGEGGTSTVYLAHQRQLGRQVALKVVKTKPGDGGGRQVSLVTEAALTGSLEHPNIVPIHALGCDASGRPILVMKRIEGVEWRKLLDGAEHPAWLLDKQDRITTHLQILMQVANALEYAHSRGVIHRDVKPENVMLGSFGEVYLVDWGIARRLSGPPERFRLVGTPAYMAPEMVLGPPEAADPRTDVYLLGTTLHVILTGEYRHTGNTVQDALFSALESKPHDYGTGVPVELAALCNAATHRDKRQRPQSAAAFRQAVDAYLRHGSSIAVARSAQEKLDDLSGRLGSGAPLVSVEVAQRLAECQFGFLEALRGWNENQLAQDGLRACRLRLVEREIALRNAAAARALAANLEPPDPVLLARIAALETALEAESQQKLQSARSSRAKDASVLWAVRALMLAVFLLGALVANVVVMVKEIRTGTPVPIGDVVTTDLLQLGAVFLALLFTGRQLLAHSYNRQVIGVLLVTLLTVTLLDLAAWSSHIGSRTANLIDCLAMLSCFSIATVGIEVRWWRIMVVWTAAVVVAALVPVLANGAASLATIVTIVIGIQVARRAAEGRTANPGELD
jgi:hypothetical protein